MTDDSEFRVLRGARVLRSEHAVQVPVHASIHEDVMTVVPLPGRGRLEGFEVRCRCGSRIVVDCTPLATPATPPEPTDLEETDS